MTKAVFLDKDGTLVVDVPFNVDPAQMVLYEETGTALAQLRQLGYRLFVVSNQSGVAQGFFPECALEPVWQRLQELLAPYGVGIDGFYYCPHDPAATHSSLTADCDCRKPKPGMLLRAAQTHRLDLTRSWMIGDILNDVEAGNRAGCRTILIDRGNETEWQTGPWRTPTHLVSGWPQAVACILNA